MICSLIVLFAVLYFPITCFTQPPFKGDGGAIRTSALLRVPQGQAGLRNTIGSVRPSGEVSDRKGAKFD